MNWERAWQQIDGELGDKLKRCCPDPARLNTLLARIWSAVDAGWLAPGSAVAALGDVAALDAPSDTLLFLAQFLEDPAAPRALAEPGALGIFVELANQGEHPARLLQRHPDDLLYLTQTRKNPSYWLSQRSLEELIQELDARIQARTLSGAPLQPALIAELRRFKRRESLRIFLREIERTSSVRQTAQEIALLAEACIETACIYGAQLLGAPALVDNFCVLGMGKLGGRELNFSSDIDLIFVSKNSPIPPTNNSESPQKSRLTQLARWVTRALGDITDDGYVFRVDLRLRPEGSKGELVNSAEAMVDYYLNWGSTWERSALLKARPVGGNRQLGARLIERLEPFIFRRYLDFQVIDELRAMKEQIDQNAQAVAILGLDESSSAAVEDEQEPESSLKSRLRKRFNRQSARSTLSQRRPTLAEHSSPAPPNAAKNTVPGTSKTRLGGSHEPAYPPEQRENRGLKSRADLVGTPYGWDIKIGLGGIREIEFFVQALQLIHSGTRTSLRVRATLDALDRLLYAGLISHEDHAILADSYDLFRRIEHRVQMERDRQSHRLPGRPDAFLRLARRLDMGAAELETRLTEHRKQVATIFERLFRDSAQTSDEPTVRELRPGEIATIMGVGPRDLFKSAVLDALVRLGFSRPRQVAGQLQVLRERSDGPFSRRASLGQHQLAHYILEAAASAPNPDQAFSYWARFATILGERPDFYQMLYEYPHATRLLIHLFGSSEFLSAIVLREPNVIDYLLGANTAAIVREREQMARELARRLGGISDPAHRMGRVRRFYQEELLRIALHEVAGACEIDQTTRQLSMLAEVIIDAVLDEVFWNLISWQDLGSEEAPGLKDLGFVVLGMGKLGGRELTFGSDLDLVFIYDPTLCPQLEPSFYIRLAQRLVRNLSSVSAEGKLYDVDTRLRPLGGQGILVVSVDSFEDYHRHHADLWERQAMLKARALTGPAPMRERIMALRREVVFERPAPPKLAETLGQMRDRLIAELGSDSESLDIKYDPGGMIDVEFLTQLFQLTCDVEPPTRPTKAELSGADIEQGVRSQNTIRALYALAAAQNLGGAGSDDADRPEFLGLIDDYLMLRRVEARLRMRDLRASNRLPDTPHALSILARQLGYQGSNADARLMAELSALNLRVLQAFQGARRSADP